MRYICAIVIAMVVVPECFGANLRYGNTLIPLDTVKKTSPSMVFSVNGGRYYAPLVIGRVSGRPAVNYNGAVYSVANEILWYEQTAINTCESSVVLPAGSYRVELRGGRGGDGGTSGLAGLNANVAVYSFNLGVATAIYAFRGGDGNGGANGATGGNAGSNGRGPGSGGASGVPSMLAVGGSVYKSEGGSGGRGGDARCYDGTYTNSGGGGGGGTDNANGLDAYWKYALNDNMCLIGAGGGGAPAGIGGEEVSGNSYGGGSAGNGSIYSGASGGSAWRVFSKESGGAGGASVTWSCSGQTLYSYGGGGAGAVNLRAISTFNKVGVPGGSGSTGASSTSYVRIYKLY